MAMEEKVNVKAAAITAISQSNGQSKTSRISVQKTYKIYIDGKFPRTESGRYYILADKEGNTIANVCRSSRKDFRDAVVAARKSQPGWAAKSAYNKGQILYRIAEMLEGRRAQFIDELTLQGISKKAAESEVNLSVDRLVYYAGWTDKYQQVFSSVNPVESSHFNFSVPEPMGIVAAISPEQYGLIGLVSVIAPAITGGNTIIALASSAYPLCSITFGEVLNSSDVPAGVVNILTGHRSELISNFATHMDVNSILYCGDIQEDLKKVQEAAALNVKRPVFWKKDDYLDEKNHNPYRIMEMQEIKTTWHPIGQ